MTDKEILDRLLKHYRIYLDRDMKPVEGYDDTFYDGVLWAFARLTEIQSNEEKSQEEWIDYDNTFYKCPECGYLLEKCCPQCQNKVVLPEGGADIRKPNCVTCDHFGKCEGCEKRDEE